MKREDPDGGDKGCGHRTGRGSQLPQGSEERCCLRKTRPALGGCSKDGIPGNGDGQNNPFTSLILSLGGSDKSF